MAKPVIADVHAESEVNERQRFLFRPLAKCVAILLVQLLIKHGKCFLERLRNGALCMNGRERGYDN